MSRQSLTAIYIGRLSDFKLYYPHTNSYRAVRMDLLHNKPLDS